jgi:hypothetical protein
VSQEDCGDDYIRTKKALSAYSKCGICAAIGGRGMRIGVETA